MLVDRGKNDSQKKKKRNDDKPAKTRFSQTRV